MTSLQIRSQIRSYENNLSNLRNELENAKKYLQNLKWQLTKFNKLNETIMENVTIKKSNLTLLQSVPNVKFAASAASSMQSLLAGTKFQSMNTASSQAKAKLINKQRSLEEDISRLNKQIVECESKISNLNYQLRQALAEEAEQRST